MVREFQFRVGPLKKKKKTQTVCSRNVFEIQFETAASVVYDIILIILLYSAFRSDVKPPPLTSVDDDG